MKRHALTLALPATLAAAALLPATANAGLMTVDLCPASGAAPAGQSGWSTVTTGGAIYPSATPAAWADVCSRPRAGGETWAGAGGAFGDTALPGSTAFLRFTPPAGSSIVQVTGFQNLSITAESHAEAGVFTSTGRNIDPTLQILPGTGDTATYQFNYAADSLGSDGAGGLLFGSRCPSSLPAGVDSCGGAGSAYAGAKIYMENPSPPALNVSATLDNSNGMVTVNWTATDPQSGISSVGVGIGTAELPSKDTTFACSTLGAPMCPVTVSGSTTIGPLPANGPRNVTLGASGPGNGATWSQKFTWTRPGQAPTPTPAPTTPGQPTPTPGTSTLSPQPPSSEPKISMKTKAKKGRKLVVSGTASGCKKVSLRTPRSKRSKSATVRKGRWSITVPRTKGTYRAKCGSVSAKRTTR
ncbi:MAG: hypothetical protein Q7T55_06475 [Solirubrobacteraceae bacterium]|nr:hypothetical protein [Solirubrobacteraceae bacterium]